MPHRDAVNWVVGAAIVLATVLFVSVRPPTREATMGLRGARILFVFFGVLLGAIILVAMICAGR